MSHGDFRVQHFEEIVNPADSETDISIPLPVVLGSTR
ncbi:unnamed protein product, partial [marine sediment metagenome]